MTSWLSHLMEEEVNEEDIYSKLLDVTYKESPLVEEGRK